MHQSRRREGSVGNSNHKTFKGFQGIKVPVPLDDFDWAPPSNMGCRAASSSAYGDRTQVTQCAGKESHSHLFKPTQVQNPFGDTSTKSTRDSALDQFEETLNPDPHRFDLFDDFALPPTVDGQLPGAPGPDVVAIQGGGKNIPACAPTAQHEATMHTTFASTTECILQNLTMAVGNPSARCCANAPWRAFTWTCALLQETCKYPTMGQSASGSPRILGVGRGGRHPTTARAQATVDKTQPQHPG